MRNDMIQSSLMSAAEEHAIASKMKSEILKIGRCSGNKERHDIRDFIGKAVN